MKRTRKLLITTIFLMIVSVLLTGCGIKVKDPNKNLIITTLYPQYDMVKQIIGSDPRLSKIYEVSLIVPPGVDSHTYDPSVSDLIKIKNCDLFIYTSHALETWVEKLNIEQYTNVLDLSEDERIELIKSEAHTDEHEEEHAGHDHDHELDPHFWVYPIYAKYMVEEIRDKLIEILPPGDKELNIATINKHADTYIEQLEKLDQDLKEIVALAPNKTFYFASPFSFFYWSHYYGLEYVLTYATCSTEVEPSLTTIVDIINRIKQNNVPAIYIKELQSITAAEMISRNTGAEILMLHSCHNVSKDDFNNPEVSFLSLMRQNMINLAKGLQVDITAISNIVTQEEANNGTA